MTSRVLVSVRVPATPERAFEAFTQGIGDWWTPNALFRTTPKPPGVLAFEDGRLVERLDGGRVFEIGRVQAWEPPERLAFGWRQASFPPDLVTQVEVRFEAVGAETRVTVEHSGFDRVPADNVARHGFPDHSLLARLGDWWTAQLSAYKQDLGGAHG